METVRLVIEVKPEIKSRFKEATREKGSNMKAEINRFIRNYIKKNGAK